MTLGGQRPYCLADCNLIVRGESQIKTNKTQSMRSNSCARARVSGRWWWVAKDELQGLCSAFTYYLLSGSIFQGSRLTTDPHRGLLL